MEKKQFKNGAKFIYHGHIYKIEKASVINKAMEIEIYFLFNYAGYYGSANDVTEKSFNFYAVVMGEFFEKEILFKDCKLIN